MNGITVDTVASSWIDALGGLSHRYMRSVPPCFWANVGPAAASKAAPHAATMVPTRWRMVSSLFGTGVRQLALRVGNIGPLRWDLRSSFSADLAHPTLFPRVGVRIDHVARLVGGRMENHLARQIAELLDAVGLDVLELHQQHALLRPFALVAELHVADDGLEGRLADVIGQGVVIETLGRLDRVAEHLQVGVGPNR